VRTFCRAPHFQETVAPWATKRRWVGEAFEALERARYHIGSAYTAVKDPAKTRFRLPRLPLGGSGPCWLGRRVVRPHHRRTRAEPGYLGNVLGGDRARRSAARAGLPAIARRTNDSRVRAATQARVGAAAGLHSKVRRRPARPDRLTALIELYKALGGGWDTNGHGASVNAKSRPHHHSRRQSGLHLS
jgi:hypothetical protein